MRGVFKRKQLPNEIMSYQWQLKRKTFAALLSTRWISGEVVTVFNRSGESDGHDVLALWTGRRVHFIHTHIHTDQNQPSSLSEHYYLKIEGVSFLTRTWSLRGQARTFSSVPCSDHIPGSREKEGNSTSIASRCLLELVYAIIRCGCGHHEHEHIHVDYP